MKKKNAFWNTYFKGMLRVEIERMGNTLIKIDSQEWLLLFFTKAWEIITKGVIDSSIVLTDWQIAKFSVEERLLVVKRKFTWETSIKGFLTVIIEGDNIEVELTRGPLRLYFAVAFFKKYEHDISDFYLEEDWKITSFCPEEKKLIVEKMFKGDNDEKERN